MISAMAAMILCFIWFLPLWDDAEQRAAGNIQAITCSRHAERATDCRNFITCLLIAVESTYHLPHLCSADTHMKYLVFQHGNETGWYLPGSTGRQRLTLRQAKG
jgi:hypothetical protein